jgi:threonine dehydratase
MIDLSDLEEACERVKNAVRRTPLMTSSTINALCGVDLTDPGNSIYLKAETLQITGSFKIRGAYNRIFQIPDADAAKGVVTASAGNHAQGVALSATIRKIQATVFMPETASIAKIQATKGYGADVVLEGRTYDEAVIAAQNFQKRKGALFVPAYDDDGVIAGQGTLGMEILDDLPLVDTVIIPVGGGGLFSGVAAAIRAKRPKARIIGVQSAGANTAVKSFLAGKRLQRLEPIDTICDGIAVKAPSERTFEYIQKYADDMVEVEDVAVSSTLLLLMERMKLVVEPSGAAPLAALLSGKAKPYGRTAVILSGGNVDVKLLSDLIQREMLKENRYYQVMTAVQDKPGSLAPLLDVIASQRANVLSVHHNHINPTVPLGWTGVEVLVEVRDKAHSDALMQTLKKNNYPIDLFNQYGSH